VTPAGRADDGSPAAELFVPPEDNEFAGLREFESPRRPYDNFMESEGLPIYRDIGYPDVCDLPLADWDRMGGRGAYVQLLGTEGIWGMYLVEIPPGGALNEERHIYEKIVYVVSGRGTTEVTGIGSSNPNRFEWHTGSLFGIPMNARHRFVNGSRERVLMIVGTTAPPVINLFDDLTFVFANDYPFPKRFDGRQDYFDYRQELVPDPIRGRALQVTSLIPDIINLELPLDNQRGPGMRRIQPQMANARFYMKIMEHQVGRYSKAHYHAAGAVLICIRGAGYTYTWPRDAGLTPWKDGRETQIERVDYEHAGIVAAAPGGGNWVHQHFAVGREPLRVLALNGPPTGHVLSGTVPGIRVKSGNLGISEGGRSIDYWQEDPHIRAEFESQLASAGITSQMDDSLYQAP
jgi:quercetin dioxygenase-like cupin family protein